MGRRILITGGAGFIGSHLADSLLSQGDEVISVDNFDPFYNRERKETNVLEQRNFSRYRLIEADIRDKERINFIYKTHSPEIVVHLAAKAGVRPSVRDPQAYIDTNVNGTYALLEACVQYKVKKFLFASSSSIYGNSSKTPFSESDLPQPVSPYAATKAAGEALCRSYMNCYQLQTICLRFFTVFGPRQRPDLAIYHFAKKIMNGEQITLFGNGGSSRDYTYVSDIVSGIKSAMNFCSDQYEEFNIGSDRPIKLAEVVRTLEKTLGRRAILDWAPMQVGDVEHTWADLSKSRRLLRYSPETDFETGVRQFVTWIKAGKVAWKNC